ncbi:protein-tyrosine phosphatase-like protein [Pelagophyceae sp. CCMP2097]|nr:protein-tyrosine phosphatase-like protein [Pelagophyceae sp. CCMP2097]
MRWLVACIAFGAAFALQRPPASLPQLPKLEASEALLASHGFSGAANWLVPGHVLLGANPNKGRGSGTARIVRICGVGCETFVSLQEEAEERDGGYFVDVEASAETPRFVRFPIEDLRPAPSLKWLDETVCLLAERVLAGEVLYVHCFAGRGRTGLVAACLLGALYGHNVRADEALQRVAAYYRLRANFGADASRAADGMSPETEPQRQQVRDWYASRLAEDTL